VVSPDMGQTGCPGREPDCIKISMIKKAFFVAMKLGRARQAAGETLTVKSGLPELAPLLSA